MAIPAHGSDVHSGYKVYPLTESQANYLRRLIGISMGLAFTDEVCDGMDLINQVLRNKRYDDDDKEELNKLQYVFDFKKNGEKNFL